MKAFVINLDRSADRLARFDAMAEAIGLRYERFAAFDGRAMDPDALAALRADRFTFQPINDAETALFLSHRTLWEWHVASGDPWCAIFEDDVVLSSRLSGFLRDLTVNAPAADIIKLETTDRKVVLDRREVEVGPVSLRRLRSWHGGTAGYIVSLKGAQTLIDATPKLADPVDQVLFNPMSPVSRTLDIWQCVPGLAIQAHIQDRSAGTDSTMGRASGKHGPFRHGPVTDARRTMLKLAERARRTVVGLHPARTRVHVAFDQRD